MEELPNLIRYSPQRSLANLVEIILVNARVIEPAKLLEQLLIVRVRRGQGGGGREVRRGVLGEDLLEQANEIQETLGRSYAVPDEIDEADLQAGAYPRLLLVA